MKHTDLRHSSLVLALLTAVGTCPATRAEAPTAAVAPDVDRLFQEARAQVEHMTRVTEAGLQEAERRRAAAPSEETSQHHDNGIASTENFVVVAPDGDFLADAVVQKAEALRSEIARTWLGTDLVEGDAFSVIDVSLSDELDEGLVQLRDGRRGRGHRIWLTTSEELALGSTLAHELAHVVLHARFRHGHGMPAWSTEGISSSYDDSARKNRRRGILADIVRQRQWPQVAKLMDADAIQPTDQTAYAVAVSLTEFFVEQGGNRQFLDFVEAGQAVGWDQALVQHYRIQDRQELQQRWESWVEARFRGTAALPGQAAASN
jgi:hypothetical protein